MSVILSMKSWGQCPGLYLPGHVVTAVRPVRRSPVVDGGDNRSIDVSMLVRRHGGQCLRLLGSRSCRISKAAVVWFRCPRVVYGTDGTGSVSVSSAWSVFRVLTADDEMRSRVTRLFPRDITPPVILVSLHKYVFKWRAKFTTSHYIKLLLLYSLILQSWLLQPDFCAGNGLEVTWIQLRLF